MEIEKAKELVEPFLKMKEVEIFELFAGWNKNFTTFGEGDYMSLFIPGTRKDRVLMVAHVDTVFMDSPKIEVHYHDGLLRGKRARWLDEKSNNPRSGGCGIGADDRAGVAALWLLKELGHSILLTGCEELGCLGSCQLMANDKNAALMQEHQFAIQFDRQGRNDVVFYNVGSPAFEKYVVEQPGYNVAEGTFTDICVLCEEICGVNISIGYKNEHRSEELLNLRWWIRTVQTAHKWLKQSDLKRFTH